MKSIEFDKLIRPIKISNCLMGIWPVKKTYNAIIKFLYSFYFYIMIIAALIQSVATATDAVHHYNELDEATEIFLILCTNVLSLFRFAAFWSHKRDVAYVIKVMRSDWNSSDYETINILKQKCYVVYKLAKFFMANVMLSFSNFVIEPFLQVNIFIFKKICRVFSD